MANPAPLGLMGFGMTTVLLNIHNADFAGYKGIICGLSAIYLAMTEVMNETYGKTILPIGGPTIK